jgi:hypothetical protein
MSIRVVFVLIVVLAREHDRIIALWFGSLICLADIEGPIDKSLGTKEA